MRLGLSTSIDTVSHPSEVAHELGTVAPDLRRQRLSGGRSPDKSRRHHFRGIKLPFNAVRSAVVAVLMLGSMLVGASDLPVYFGVGGGVSQVDGTAHTDRSQFSSFPPTAVPLNGLPFDDDKYGWSAFAGYAFHRFIAVELGYLDLGTFESGVLTFPGSNDEPRIDVSAPYVAAQFRYPLGERFAATWSLGVSRARYDVSGSTVVRTPIFFPNPSPFLELPFADISDETGFMWGFGFSWLASEHLDVDLRFTRNDVQVFDVDTFDLRVRISPW